MTIRTAFLSAFLLSVTLPLVAQEAAAPEQPQAPRRVSPIAALRNNPEAWNEPEFHIAIVNESKAVDGAWLDETVKDIVKQSMLRFVVVETQEADGVDAKTLLANAKTAAGDKAKGYIILSKKVEMPILTSPGMGWAIMNPEWVLSDKEADNEKNQERMGKQLRRAIGMAFGAGFRPEKEALLRIARTPQELDEARSKNYHPQTLGTIQAVARSLGIERRKLKPREELEKMGLIPPRKPKAEEPTAEK